MNINNIKVDESTFDETARILSVINGEIVGDYNHCKAMMLEMVKEHGHESAYFGTAGFYIVCFTEKASFQVERPQRHAKATLMPYTVQRYLKQIGKM